MTHSDYRDTVFLPRTSFGMKADLPKREPLSLKQWEQARLWEQMRARAKGRPLFILHDGPPYANGHLHIGHALNKILKDIINRSRQLAGQDALYIPGWDCHGLPIEWKVEEEYRASGRDKDEVPVLDFRAECRAYAEKWMTIQRDEFIRLGIAADWCARYATMDFASEAAIAAEIGKFLLSGALYRGLRPVLWSPVEKTALAEAEVEYYDHKSTAVWVRFPIVQSVGGISAGGSVPIWTTTPWTIPGNRAIAAGPDIHYCVIKVTRVRPDSLARDGELLLVAAARLDSFLSDVGITDYDRIGSFPGSHLKGLLCRHPLASDGYSSEVPVLTADFVTTEAGTGFVHIAPGHGEDDFNLGRSNGLNLESIVGDDGRFLPHIPLFAGLHVYKADQPVVDALRNREALLKSAVFVHSYPHSWRSKAPLIYRATPQWFIRMDGPENIRRRALEAIAQTRFVPEQGRNRIGSMVASRPDWCISRQRAWGVPIPVFVDRRSGEPLRDEIVMRRVVEAFRTDGADAWYARPKAYFLGAERDPEDFDQVRDVVDVWFESGATHAFVLEERGLPWPADLYLEGSDQHRGWFHSSLLEAVGTRGRAPYKAILTHGFVLDESGRKMSKSLGNVTAPQEVVDRYGADILRLWVATSDTADDLRIGPDILRQQAELYRRIRNTLRWLLGSLENFSDIERVVDTELPELERWVLHRLTELDQRIRSAVESYDWTGVYPDLHNFCNGDLSAFYFDIRKDVIYCDRPDSARRRAARTVLDHLHRCLTTWFAPVLCFTADEAWRSRFGDTDSVHLQTFPELPSSWRDDTLATKWERIRARRHSVMTSIEVMRQQGVIGSSLQANVTLGFEPGEETLLSPGAWAEVLIVSGVAITPSEASGFSSISVAEGTKCARCWRVLPEVGEDVRHPTLCRRCTDAVLSGLVCRSAA